MKAMFSTLDKDSNGNFEESELLLLFQNSSEFKKVYYLVFYTKYSNYSNFRSITKVLQLKKYYFKLFLSVLKI